MQTSERVVLIKGDATKWYSQVVFIMNPKNPGIPVDLVAEAERIILDYKRRNDYGNAVRQDELFEVGRGLSKANVDSRLDASNPVTRLSTLHTIPSWRGIINRLQYVFMTIACVLLAVIIAIGLLR